MSDLGDVLARESELAGRGVEPLDATRYERLVAGARRRRRRRHGAETLAAVAGVAVLGTAGWFGLHDLRTPQPAHTPTPTPTVTSVPTPSVAPSSTPTPDGPAVRASAIDDATVLRHLLAPRTGETWTTPTEVTDGPHLVAVDWTPEPRTFRVGARGDATIYVVAGDLDLAGARVYGLFEVDAAGPRFIACPSARVEDPCAEGDLALAEGVAVDRDTFYDSIVLPHRIETGAGYAIGTAATLAQHAAYGDLFSGVLYGDARVMLGQTWGTPPETVTVERQLGAAALVTLRTPSDVAGLTNVRYAWRMPYGAVVDLAGKDVPGGDFASITWDDGRDRWGERTRLLDDSPTAAVWPTTSAPGAGTCFAPTFSVETAHDASAWRPAGHTPEGLTVYVPVSGGNAVSRAVRTWQSDHSFTLDDTAAEFTPIEGADAYAVSGYGTDAAFLDANAVYATQTPDGTWLLGLRADATQIVYECA